MKHTEIVKRLFAWTSKNLVSDAPLKKSDLAEFFASEFIVIANGRNYDANYDNYFEFLNQFRSTIRKIDYNLDQCIEDKDHVVIPLKAKIIRTDGSIEAFEAILILQFNQDSKIILWREVYLKV